MPRPSRPWFRFYSEAVDNPKIHELPERLFKPWVFMLCLAATNTPRGRLPSVHTIAFKLRCSEDKAKGIVSALVERRFIDPQDGGYAIHDWDGDNGWQYDSDANLTPGRQGKNELRTPKERVKNAEPPRKEHAKNAVARRRSDTDTEQKQSRAEAEQKQKRAPVLLPDDEGLAEEWQRGFETLTGKPWHATYEVIQLVKEFGLDNVRTAAKASGWDKHPNWLREKLSHPRRPVAAANGASARPKSRIYEERDG